MNISLKSFITGLTISLVASSAFAADPYAADRQALKNSAEAVLVETDRQTLSTRSMLVIGADETLKGYGGR